jgi:phosphoglycerol geranylgeranyltransferase
MSTGPVYEQMLNAKALGKKSLALLIDPDKSDLFQLAAHLQSGQFEGLDYFFVGGSLITSDLLSETIRMVKNHSDLPVILFPGSNMHLDPQADAILFLSLISGRNPEYLIGQHVVAAPVIKRTRVEVISTGYMVVDGGKPTTVSYMSHSAPIPADKPEIAASTAIAGEMLGMKTLYLDAGSGAERPVSGKMIRMTRNNIEAPLIVGGGIKNAEQALESWKAGADIIVVGNAAEKNYSLIPQMLEKAGRISS